MSWRFWSRRGSGLRASPLAFPRSLAKRCDEADSAGASTPRADDRVCSDSIFGRTSRALYNTIWSFSIFSLRPRVAHFPSPRASLLIVSRKKRYERIGSGRTVVRPVLSFFSVGHLVFNFCVSMHQAAWRLAAGSLLVSRQRIRAVHARSALLAFGRRWRRRAARAALVRGRGSPEVRQAPSPSVRVQLLHLRQSQGRGSLHFRLLWPSSSLSGHPP